MTLLVQIHDRLLDSMANAMPKDLVDLFRPFREYSVTWSGDDGIHDFPSYMAQVNGQCDLIRSMYPLAKDNVLLRSLVDLHYSLHHDHVYRPTSEFKLYHDQSRLLAKWLSGIYGVYDISKQDVYGELGGYIDYCLSVPEVFDIVRKMAIAEKHLDFYLDESVEKEVIRFVGTLDAAIRERWCYPARLDDYYDVLYPEGAVDGCGSP